MQPVKNAVIAAAGLGSRLGLGMPKCMISINKTPILTRMLRMLEGHVETIVVVTGYREELISEYCEKNFRNVIIARNPDFATTNTAHSLSLGARFAEGKTIFLDGDLLLEKQSLASFFQIAQKSEILVGVAQTKTDQPVYADCVGDLFGGLVVNGFSRGNASTLEWANLVVGPKDLMDGAQHFVFERLAERLPLQAALVEVEEVDTPQDMVRAEAALKMWEA